MVGRRPVSFFIFLEPLFLLAPSFVPTTAYDYEAKFQVQKYRKSIFAPALPSLGRNSGVCVRLGENPR